MRATTKLTYGFAIFGMGVASLTSSFVNSFLEGVLVGAIFVSVGSTMISIGMEDLI